MYTLCLQLLRCSVLAICLGATCLSASENTQNTTRNTIPWVKDAHVNSLLRREYKVLQGQGHTLCLKSVLEPLTPRQRLRCVTSIWLRGFFGWSCIVFSHLLDVLVPLENEGSFQDAFALCPLDDKRGLCCIGVRCLEVDTKRLRELLSAEKSNVLCRGLTLDEFMLKAEELKEEYKVYSGFGPYTLIKMNDRIEIGRLLRKVDQYLVEYGDLSLLMNQLHFCFVADAQPAVEPNQDKGNNTSLHAADAQSTVEPNQDKGKEDPITHRIVLAACGASRDGDENGICMLSEANHLLKFLPINPDSTVKSAIADSLVDRDTEEKVVLLNSDTLSLSNPRNESSLASDKGGIICMYVDRSVVQ